LRAGKTDLIHTCVADVENKNTATNNGCRLWQRPRHRVRVLSITRPILSHWI